MTDDVMKKVESLLFDEDDEEVQLQEIKEIPEEKESVEKPRELERKKEEVEQKRGFKKEEKSNKPKKEISMDFVEIFFDGYVEIQGAKIKVVPGSEIEVESGNLKFVFGDDSVKVYEI